MAEPSATQTAAIRTSCRSDFMVQCPGVAPGGKDALLCLQRSVARLSPACKAAVMKTTSAPAPGGRVVAAPVPIAPPPVAAAPAVAPLNVRPFIMPERRVVIMAICHGDAERLCRGVPPIGPSLFQCLAAQAASLSPPCYDALARISRP